MASIRTGLKNPGWPVKTPPLLPGSILPAARIVAFYGNPLSKRMGILGEIPYAQMLAKLDSTVAQWRRADPGTPVVPALHLIVSVAQGLPGKDGMYRQRSDPDLIEKIYGMAHARGAMTILDIQAGRSTIDAELPLLIPFLSRPDVHLGIDPEFYMHYNREGRAPGTKIGSMDARDVDRPIFYSVAVIIAGYLPIYALTGPSGKLFHPMAERGSRIWKPEKSSLYSGRDRSGSSWLRPPRFRGHR